MINIVGDLHIGKGCSLGRVGLLGSPNSRITDQLDLLDWILEQTLANGDSHIVITGDVFEDPKPSPTLIAYFITWLKKCEDNSITVHIIQGNHDMLRNGSYNTSALDVIIESDMPMVVVYKDITTIYIDNIAITIVPFRDRKSFNLTSNAMAVERVALMIAYEMASIPTHYRKLLIGHLAIDGAIYVGDEVDDVANELIMPLSTFAGYDYVWMGHIHKPQVLQSKTSSRPLVAHIGSMDISNFGEAEEDKIIISFDTAPKTIALPTRPLKHITVEVPADTKNTTQYVIDQITAQGSLARALVRIEIQLASAALLPVERAELEKAVYALGAFNVANISESKPSSIAKKTQSTLDTTMSIPASLKTWIEANVPADKQEATLALALDCYREYGEQ
jgi:DNA repair exonuclease SbcCD nuclease subunit